ncbi:hypothetical protein [Corynebacterium sp. Marseille-P4611]|nr:hypothetical protein [Corynebacterium sp. Marseille-P4611]
MGFELGFVVVCPAGVDLLPWEGLGVLDFEVVGVGVPGDVVEGLTPGK